MTRWERALDTADGRMRALLMGGLGRGGHILCGAATLAAFIALLLTRTFALLAGQALSLRAATAALLCLPLLLMLAFGLSGNEKRGGGALHALLVCALCACAMLARLSFIERSSGDYDIYLAAWLEKLAAGSFAEGMRADIGEYNVLYQYLLFLITRLPVPPLYAVKAVSFCGDALLAGAAARLAAREGRPSFCAFGVGLLLPAFVLNAGMFAQCDSLYAGCALWGLALALEGRHARSAACFALSLAFKLQAAFLLPMAVVLWADRKMKLSDALVFLATLALVALPAMLGGKSLARIVGIYGAQTGLYTGLNYGAANLFGLMNTQGLDVYAYGNFGMALAFGACALLVASGVGRAGKLDEDGYVRLAFLMTLFVVFLLPRMHERYFYLAEALAVALACRRPRMWSAACLTAVASLSTLWDLHIPLPVASAMMLFAGVLALLPDKSGGLQKNSAENPH